MAKVYIVVFHFLIVHIVKIVKFKLIIVILKLLLGFTSLFPTADLAGNSFLQHELVKLVPIQVFYAHSFHLFALFIIENGLWCFTSNFFEFGILEFCLKILEDECLHLREPIKSSSRTGLNDTLPHGVAHVVEHDSVLSLC